MDQIKSVVGEDALNLGFLYKSHPSSRLITSRFSFIHKTLYEFFLAYFIKHNNLDSFKQSLYKNRQLLNPELSLTRFILHLYMSKKEAFEFTTSIIGSNPDWDLFTYLLKLYIGYKHDEHQATLTFNDNKYCYIYQYPCYAICGDKGYHHQDSLSSYNKDMIRRMNTDNKHKAVTVPLLQTASEQDIRCGHPYLSGCDLHVYCRPDYEVTVIGDAHKLKELYLYYIEKMGDIHLHPVNDSLDVYIQDTNLHGCVGLTKPWVSLIPFLMIKECSLEAGDISFIADSIQACTSSTEGEPASPCRLKKLNLRYNSLTGAGADIGRIITLLPLCT